MGSTAAFTYSKLADPTYLNIANSKVSVMRLYEFRTRLNERVVRIDADGHPISVIANPTARQIVNLLENSPDEMVKGLIIGDDVFFWGSASKATHGHVAEHLWPTDGIRAYWEYSEYVDNRLIVEMDDGYPTIDFEPMLLQNSKILTILKSDLIYFNFPGAGFMNYSEYLANDLANQKQDAARRARMAK